MKRLLALAMLLVACSGDDKTLQVFVVTPFANDPLQQAATITINAGTGHTQTVPVTSGHYNLSFTFSTSSSSQIAPIFVEARDASGTLVARGQSPPLALAPANGNVFIYVAPPGSMGSPAAANGTGPSMMAARSHHAVAYYPGLGLFAAGGIGPGGATLDSISLWFSYELQESTNPDTFKLTAARSDLAGGYDSQSGLIDWAGGTDTTGAPTSLVEVMDPTGQIGLPYVRPLTLAGQAPVERSAAAAAYSSTDQGFLLFGGLGHDKTPQPGAVLFTLTNTSQPVSWLNAVARLGATATPVDSGTTIIVFGGGPPGSAPLEKYTRMTMGAAVLAPAGLANRTNHTATDLGDGRILLVGGTDDSGAPLGSATVYKPIDNSFMDLPNFLAHPRSGHTATIAGGELLIAGGADGNGPIAECEAYDASTLVKLREVNLSVPRTHHTATNDGTESVVIIGGEDNSGAPVGLVEIYEPAQ